MAVRQLELAVCGERGRALLGSSAQHPQAGKQWRRPLLWERKSGLVQLGNLVAACILAGKTGKSMRPLPAIPAGGGGGWRLLLVVVVV